MDLMTLAAKITLDDSSYTKGINNAEKMGQQLAGRMSAMTVAVGNLAADVIKKTVSSIGGVVNSAVDGYANYQQLIGGVETLFKTSSDKVRKYAEQSYKTTGLSANAYMETVTSFSASLLQGLGGDTEKAADMANLAITDMADNANKMGTDIGSIQSAYQGFAKQNYTMLDNLKLGYGGTAGEMVRLINDSKILDHEIENLDGITFDELVQAIHVVQTEIGITGTTAQEAASTISGSRASLEASWADFLVSIGGEADQQKLQAASQRFQEAFNSYVTNNLAPTIQTTIENAPELISAVSEAISSLPSKGITELVNGGVDLLTATVEGATQIGGWLVDGLVGLFRDINADPTKIADLGNAVGEFIGSALSDIATNAPTIISGLFTAGVTLAGSIIEGLFSGLFGSNSPLDEVSEEMNDSIIEANINAEKSKSILDYMEGLVAEYGKGVEQTEAFKKAQEELEQYMGEKAGQVFVNYGSDIQGAIEKLRELSQEMRKMAILDAMRKSINKQYEILGETGAQLAESEYRRDTAQSFVDNYQEILRQNMSAYAGELIARTKNLDPTKRSILLGNEEYVNAVANGTATEGMDTQEMINQISSWHDTLAGIYELMGADESSTLWGKNLLDQIFSSDEIDALSSEVTKAQDTIKTETENIATLQKEYDEILKNITVSEQALQKQAQKIVEDAGLVDDGSSSMASVLRKKATEIASIRFPSYLGIDPVHFVQEATGIDYVPFTGFKASLHRGEAVITASENARRLNGTDTGDVVAALQGVRNDLQNLRLMVGEKEFGRAVVRYSGNRMDDYIGRTEMRTLGGYGM